ncbi:MAG: tyrosine-type recombinase/integrase, partial [Pseudomonadota bacterium]
QHRVNDERNQYQAKGDKEMITPLNPRAEQAMGEYLEWCQHVGYSMNPDDFIFRPTKNPRQADHLNKPLDAKAVNYIIKKYAKKIGIKGRVTVHSARSTVIGMLLDKGISIDKVADFVGHRDMGTTKSYNKRKSKLQQSPTFEINF